MQERLTQGVICSKDNHNFIYKIAKIDYTEYENGEYSYSFTPFYNVIDMLPSSIFQGIPGLNLSVRKAVYTRKNIVPTFVSERTPGENRENLYELLAECGMDFLNRLEWLIRTKTHYCGDNLFVKRFEPADDGVTIRSNSMYDLVAQPAQLNKKLLEIICYGDNLVTKEIVIDDSNRAEHYNFLMPLYLNALQNKKQAQQAGINRCKTQGGFGGRARLQLDELELQTTLTEFAEGRINEETALERLKVSHSTFFRRLREFRAKARK
ncbi:MAG: hypothetical protein RR416_04900 [Clostridia bacterium]